MSYYKDTEPTGIQERAFYYDKQIRSYILQCMAIFSGLHVQIGRRKVGTEETPTGCDGETTERDVYNEERLIPVNIHYAHPSRLVASILGENTQNKPIRLPMMGMFMRNLEFKKEYFAGTGTEQRYTYVPTGGLIPDDVRVIHQKRAVPFDMEFELALYASNTDQMFQMLEQILILFNPMLQIQTNDAMFDTTKLTNVELTNVMVDSNYPIGNDRRIVQSTLTFRAPIYLSAPSVVRDDFVKQLYIRLGAVGAAVRNDYDIVSELDKLGIQYDLAQDLDDLSVK